MTTTYKKLASYFLERNQSSGTGYGYGYETASENKLPETFSSVRADTSLSIAFNGEVRVSATQEDGKIVVGGDFSSVGGSTRNNIARLNADGTLDGSFNPNINGTVTSLAIQSDGKILVGGSFTTVGGVSKSKLARLNSNGTLDATFTSNANESAVLSIKIQPDERVIVTGHFTTINGTTRNRIARINQDGSLDTGFNPNANGLVYKTATQDDGRIIIVGAFTTIGGTTRNYLARLNIDGTLDSSFNPGANSTIEDVAIQEDGYIVVSGVFSTIAETPRSAIARLDASGNLDSTFSAQAAGTWQLYPGSAIAIQADGKILFGAQFDAVIDTNGQLSRNRIVRINTDGSIDLNFDPIVGLVQTTGLPESKVRSIEVQPNGKILVGGTFDRIGSVTRTNFARLSEVVSSAPYKLIHSSPANTETIIEKIFATNHNDFPVFYDVAIVPYADIASGVSEKHHYVWDDLIEPNGYNSVNGKVTLSEGDEVYVYSSTDESMSFNIFGVEISE